MSTQLFRIALLFAGLQLMLWGGGSELLAGADASSESTAAVSADDEFKFGIVPPRAQTEQAAHDHATDEQIVVTRDELRSIVEEMVREQQAANPPPADPFGLFAQLRSEWQDFQNRDAEKAFPTVHLHGVFQADAGWFHQNQASLDAYDRIQDGAGFRRFRLSADGSIVDGMNYFAQVDFGAFGRPTIMDLWLEQKNVPLLGTVRVGQWKQPFSLEVVSSFRYTTFMERSTLFIPFTTFRRIGVGFYDHAEDLSRTWAASVFRSGQDQYGNSLSTQGGWGTAERVTWLPYWENSGEDYLHLGAAHYFNAPPRGRAIFRTIPEFFVGQNAQMTGGSSGNTVPSGFIDGTPYFVSTGTLDVNCFNVIGTEFLWVRGPLSLQSEAMVNFINQSAGSDVALPGFYAQLGWFLTGEHRPYDRQAGAIGRVIPRTQLSFGRSCENPGCGAWEIAARLSYLNLRNDQLVSDDPTLSGWITDFTAGVNWYLNPYAKLVFNYVHSVADSPGTRRTQTDMFGLRAQVDF